MALGCSSSHDVIVTFLMALLSLQTPAFVFPSRRSGGRYDLKSRALFQALRQRAIGLSVRMELGRHSTAKDVVQHYGVDLQGKTAVVTGGHTGLGMESTKALASRGCRVLVCALDKTVGEQDIQREVYGPGGISGYGKAPSVDVEVVELDLADFVSIQRCAAELSKEPRVDMLVLNAGICGVAGETKQGLEIQMGVNHIGHAFLCQLLLPSLQRQPFVSRIVAVSSWGHAFGILETNDLQCTYTKFFGWGSYLSSKLANVVFIKGLHDSLDAQGHRNVVATCLAPGVSATGIWDRTPWLLRWLVPLFCDRNVPQCAASTVYCCVSPECGSFDNSGSYIEDCAFSQPSWFAQSVGLRKGLWDATERTIKEILLGMI